VAQSCDVFRRQAKLSNQAPGCGGWPVRLRLDPHRRICCCGEENFWVRCKGPRRGSVGFASSPVAARSLSGGEPRKIRRPKIARIACPVLAWCDLRHRHWIAQPTTGPYPAGRTGNPGCALAAAPGGQAYQQSYSSIRDGQHIARRALWLASWRRMGHPALRSLRRQLCREDFSDAMRCQRSS
jgi:hypothetical protein